MSHRVLTEETIHAAISSVEPFWWKEIIRMWGEYVPVGVVLSDEEKLGWIIASIPRAEDHLASYLADRIKTGPYDMEKPSSPSYKPTVVGKLTELYPSFMHELAMTCAQGKGIPDKYKQNEAWLCCVALNLALEWDDSYACDARSLDDLKALLDDWLVAARKEIRGEK